MALSNLHNGVKYVVALGAGALVMMMRIDICMRPLHERGQRILHVARRHKSGPSNKATEVS